MQNKIYTQDSQLSFGRYIYRIKYNPEHDEHDICCRDTWQDDQIIQAWSTKADVKEIEQEIQDHYRSI